MDGTPVTLDFSQSQPIQPAGGVSLDFSKAQRIASSPIAPPKLNVGAPDSRSIQMEPNGPIAGLPGAAPNTQPATPAMTKIAGAGIGAAALGVDGPPVVAGIARFAAKHPYITQAVGSAAISQARHIPYVGKLIPPYAEMLPMLMGGKSKAAEPAPSGDIGEAPIEGEYVDSPEPSIAKPGGPPFADAEEINVHEPPPPAPYRKVGGIEPEDVGPPDANVLAHRGGIRIARPANRGLALPPKPLNYPPAEPSGPYDGPIPAAPRGIHDTLDDQAVREEVNDAIGQSDRKWMAEDRADRQARNSPAMSKGMLTGQVDEHGIPLQPVKLTKTPGVRAIATPKSRATIAKSGPASDDDLTPILEKSLKEARIARAKK